MEMEDHGTTWVMEEKLFEAGLQEGHVTPEHALKNPSLHDGLWKVISQEAHQFCTKFVSHVSLHARDMSGFFEAIS